MAVVEPSSYEEAQQHSEWVDAMETEMEMIHKNQTWELVPRPDERKVIGVKWIYKAKMNPNGTVNKYKARLVARGFAQESGVDYFETFAPVARFDTIRLLIALAAQKKWKIHQLDIKSAFLNGELEEDVFVEQPEGFQSRIYPDHVCKLKKALYGLKQAPRAWYSKIDGYLCAKGFRRSENEHTLYVKSDENSDILILSMYVDDLLITGNSKKQIDLFADKLKEEFEMTNLGEMKYFLGIEVEQTENGIFISQKKYASDILKRFKMQQCKPVDTPVALNTKLSKEDGDQPINEKEYRSLVGSLLYLTATRPDLMFAASLLSRFMSKPSQTHFGVAKRVLRYIKGTINHGIYFAGGVGSNLIGYSDSDWAGSVDDMKSTSGYLFTLGSGAFCWNSKKQEVVAQSTAEAEYIAASSAVNHAVWLRKILNDLAKSQDDPTTIMVDNQSAIAVAKNAVDHGRTKHIKVKFHAIRQAEKEGEVHLQYCPGESQIADMFTKALPKSRFEDLRLKIGVLPKSFKEENVDY